MKPLSPICICPYSRLRHLQRTIEALKRNPEAAASDLYLFSDAPRPGDEERVAAVRRYLREIRGFRSVEIIEREENNHFGNWASAEMSLLEAFGRVISLEDDIVVAPGFLQFVNAGLERFADDPRIFAICGYTPPMRLEWVTRDQACLVPRYSGWGYGYWKRSFELVPRRIEDFDRINADPGFQERLARLGDDFLPMLRMELEQTLDAGDVRMNYVMARDDLRVVSPTISLVENIGFDNSGTHCPTTQRFSVDLGRARAQTTIPDDLADDATVIELLRRFRSDAHRSQPWQDHEILAAIESITGERRLVDSTEATAIPTESASLGEHMIFLLGLPRSGTTLLQRLLAGSSEIHTTAEPWLLLPICQMLRSSGQTAEYDAGLARQGIRDFLLELPGGEATFVNVLRRAVGELYGKCRDLHNARYFLDKTPRYHYIIPEIARLFPQAKFVVLLRNPLAVLASVAESWFNGQVQSALADPYHGRDLLSGPGHLADGLRLLGNQACVIRYEDLVVAPEAQLRRLCQYLDIDFDEAMCHYDPNFRFKGAFGDNIGIPRHHQASADSLDKWRQVLLRPENVSATQAYLAQLSHSTLDQLGYDQGRLAEEFAAALIDEVKAGNCPADLLPAELRLALADAACSEAEQAVGSGDYDAAAIGLEEALRYHPNHARALSDAGAILWALDDRSGALVYFGRAVAANSGDGNAVANYADALIAVGRQAEAKQLCFSYLERHPDDGEIIRRFLSIGDQPTTDGDLPDAATTDPLAAMTYSRRSWFEAVHLPPGHANADLDDCDLKVYQDTFMYRFILDNFPPGSRLLEIGGGDSRIIRWLRDRYEFWNLDKLEGAGNGLTELEDMTGFRLVREYIGAYSSELPDNYFDGVFSLSTLEHVPETEECYRNILADINRVLKPGGISVHAFDVVMKNSEVWTNGFLPYILDHVDLLNPPIPFWRIRLDPDTWYMSRKAYQRLWQSVTGQSWEAFGRPFSYNVLWRKPAQDNEQAGTDGETSRPIPEVSTPSAAPVAADSPTFCILPWVHLQFNPEGSVKLCCRAAGSLCDDTAVLTPYHQTLDQIWNSPALQRARRALMSGQRLPSCSMCYAEELHGSSYRTFSNQRWAEALGTTVDGLRATILANGVERGLDLCFLQLNLGNLCNLKCRMCSSTHSSQIERDPVHGRWSPHTAGNLAGVRMADQDGICRFGIRNQEELAFDGFHEPEIHEGIPCRWTDGAGRIRSRVPFPAPPHRVVLRLLAYRPIASHGMNPIPVTVRINGHEAFDGEVARGLAELELAVPETIGSSVLIEIDTPTYDRSGRRAGIGITGIDIHLTPPERGHRFNLLPLISRLETGRPWHESDRFIFEELLADSGHLREIYFTGGEPFINRQVRRIIDVLVERGDHRHIVLQFNSNFTSLDDELMATLAKFKAISLAASIDAAGRYYEYIRHPAKWARVTANVEKVLNLPNLHLSFVPIISAYNALNIVDLCQYCDSIGVNFSLHDLGGNDNIDLGVLPPMARRLAIERLRTYAGSGCRPQNLHSVIRIADRLEREPFEPGRLPEFMEFTNDLDVGRHADFQVVHAELCSLMARDGHPWQLRKRYA